MNGHNLKVFKSLAANAMRYPKCLSTSQADAHQRALLTVIGAALGAYSIYFTTYGVESKLHLYSDQIRDWRIAVGDFSDLPLHGAPSIGGGYTCGPAYYLLLWAIHQVTKPLSSLPHFAVYGLACCRAAAQVYFMVAISRWLPIVASFIIALLIATSPYEGSLSGTIWNPNVAATFSLVGLGLLVQGLPQLSNRRLAMATFAMCLAVQCHTTAILLAGPMICSMIWQRFRYRKTQSITSAILTIIATILVCEIPFALFLAKSISEPMQQSLMHQLLTSPAEFFLAINVAKGFLGVVSSLGNLILFPLATTTSISALLLVVASASIASKNGLFAPHTIIFIGTFIAAIVAFSVWPDDVDEYRLISFYGAMAASLVAGWTFLIPIRIRGGFLSLLLVAALAIQPARLKSRNSLIRMPEYASLVLGATAAVAKKQRLRAVSYEDPHFNEQALYLYHLLGGQDGSAGQQVLIGLHGELVFH